MDFISLYKCESIFILNLRVCWLGIDLRIFVLIEGLNLEFYFKLFFDLFLDYDYDYGYS